MDGIRVRVDWSNYGYISEDGATEDALPQNLFPGAPYYSGLHAGFALDLSSNQREILKFGWQEMSDASKAATNGESAIVFSTPGYPGSFWDGTAREAFIGTYNSPPYDTVPFANYSIPVTPNTTYIFRCWIRVTGSSPTMNLEFWGTNPSHTKIATAPHLAAQALSDGVWFEVSGDLTIPAGWGSTIGIRKITTATGVAPDTVELAGFEMYDKSVTSSFPAYNYGLGDLSLQDISDRVIRLTAGSGKSEFDKGVMDEGVAELTVVNDDRRFSPANTSSALYGNLVSGRKVIIDVKKSDGSWEVLWTGWTDSFAPTPGGSKDQLATIKCNQGVYRLQQGEFRQELYHNVKTDDVLAEIIARGWEPLHVPQQAFIGSAILGSHQTRLVDPEEMFVTKDQGLQFYPLLGDGWNRNTTPLKVLNDLVSRERGHLWITRDGHFEWRNRHYVINRHLSGRYDTVLNLDTDVYATSYRHKTKIVNQVEIKYQEKDDVTNASLFRTKQPIFLPGSKRGKTVSIRKDFDFEFEEGKARAVTNIYPIDEGSTFTVYVNHKKRGVIPREETAKYINKFIDVEIAKTTGGGFRAVLTNSGARSVWVEFEVFGDYIEAGSKESEIVTNETSLKTLRSVFRRTVTADEHVTDRQARAEGVYLTLRYGLPFGEFNSVEMKANLASAALDTLLTYKLGTIFLISETQTGETNQPHMVIKEDFTVGPGRVIAKYTLARLDDTAYAQLGQLDLTGNYDLYA